MSEQVNAVLYTFSHHCVRKRAVRSSPKPKTQRGGNPAASNTSSDSEPELESETEDQAHDEDHIDTQNMSSCSVWSILPPTSSGSLRYPLVVPDNWICSRADNDVQRKRWGCMTVATSSTSSLPTTVHHNHLPTTATATQVPLSRAQRTRAVLVQHLDSETFWPADSDAQRKAQPNRLLTIDPISTVGLRGNVPRTSLRAPNQAAGIPAKAELLEFHLSEREPFQGKEEGGQRELNPDSIRVPGDPVPEAPRVLHHAVPHVVSGVSSLDSLDRFTRMGEPQEADQIRGVTGLVRAILRSSSPQQQPSVEQKGMASELGMPRLANVLVAASQEVERQRGD